MVRTWIPTFLSVLLVAVPAFAGQVDGPAADEVGPSILIGQIGGLSGDAIGPSIVISDGPRATRGAALPVLYGTLVGLQAYDGWSTLKGTNHGVSESNPLLAGVASNPGAVWALKAGSTAASIFFAESLWRHHHRTQAIVMMVVVNGAMAAVAVRNSSVIKGIQ